MFTTAAADGLHGDRLCMSPIQPRMLPRSAVLSPFQRSAGQSPSFEAGTQPLTNRRSIVSCTEQIPTIERSVSDHACRTRIHRLAYTTAPNRLVLLGGGGLDGFRSNPEACPILRRWRRR